MSDPVLPFLIGFFAGVGLFTTGLVAFLIGFHYKEVLPLRRTKRTDSLEILNNCVLKCGIP